MTQKISKKDKSKRPLPDADPYQAAHSMFGREKALCPTCNVVMVDTEPCASGGEYYHPYNRCVNSGKSMSLTSWKLGFWSKGLPGETNRAKKFLKKRDRRAKNRGARLARKLRP